MPQDAKPLDEMTSAEKKELAARLRQEMRDIPAPTLTGAEAARAKDVVINASAGLFTSRTPPGEAMNSIKKMSRDTLYATLLLNEEQRQAIGCVAVESAHFDNLLDFLIWDLLGVEKERGLVVTGRIQLKQKLEMLNDLLRVRAPVAHAAFGEIYQDATDLIAKRRLIIHGTWELPPSSNKKNFLALMIAGQSSSEAQATFLKKNSPAFPATEIMGVAQEFGGLHARLIGFLVEHQVELEGVGDDIGRVD